MLPWHWPAELLSVSLASVIQTVIVTPTALIFLFMFNEVSEWRRGCSKSRQRAGPAVYHSQIGRADRWGWGRAVARDKGSHGKSWLHSCLLGPKKVFRKKTNNLMLLRTFCNVGIKFPMLLECNKSILCNWTTKCCFQTEMFRPSKLQYDF